MRGLSSMSIRGRFDWGSIARKYEDRQRLTAFSTKTFAATRDDGLGGRLLAMVNAKSLADRMGCQFGFTWNSRSTKEMQFHIVDPVDKVLSAEFIERHWLGEEIDTTRFGILGAARVTRASLVSSSSKDTGWAKRSTPRASAFSAVPDLRARAWSPMRCGRVCRDGPAIISVS